MQERLEAVDLQVRLVAVPFEVTTHPENAPSILRPNERSLCNGVLHCFLRVLPVRPDLEDFYALPGYSVSEVELGSNVRGRTTPLHELRNIALAALPLKISQRHGLPRMGDAQRGR